MDLCPDLSSPKPLDQSKNVTVRSYHKLLCDQKDQNGPKKIAKKLTKTPNWQKVAKMAKNAKVAKSPQIRLQGVSRGFRWFQVSNSMGSDDSGDLCAGTLRVRGARSGPEGP